MKTHWSRRVCAAALRLGGCLVSLAALCAYLEEGPGSLEPAHPAPGPPPEPPRPRPADEVDRFLESARVAPGFRVGGLIVFPVIRRGYDAPYCVPLDDALARGWVRVRDSGRIGRVIVYNHARRHVFILSGQTLRGGRQNRMVCEDVLLRPHSGPVSVPVYCVEKGRWQGTDEFKDAPGIAPHPLRAAAGGAASQEEIWREVRGVLDIWGISPANENAGRLYDDERVRRKVSAVLRRCPPDWPADTVGIIAAAPDGVILGCDLFGDPELFRALRHEILRSYLLGGCTDSPRVPGGHVVERDAAERFLDRIRRARVRFRRPAVDAGVMLEIRGARASGKALVFREAVIHLEAVPRTPRRLPPVRPLLEHDR